MYLRLHAIVVNPPKLGVKQLFLCVEYRRADRQQRAVEWSLFNIFDGKEMERVVRCCRDSLRCVRSRLSWVAYGKVTGGAEIRG